MGYKYMGLKSLLRIALCFFALSLLRDKVFSLRSAMIGIPEWSANWKRDSINPTWFWCERFQFISNRKKYPLAYRLFRFTCAVADNDERRRSQPRQGLCRRATLLHRLTLSACYYFQIFAPRAAPPDVLSSRQGLRYGKSTTYLSVSECLRTFTSREYPNHYDYFYCELKKISSERSDIIIDI